MNAATAPIRIYVPIDSGALSVGAGELSAGERKMACDRTRFERIDLAHGIVLDHEDLDLAIHLSKHGHKIAYKKQMIAGASSRRLDDNPKNYHKYLKMNVETYRAHGIETVTPRMTTSIFWLAYIALKPLRSSYDEDSGRISLKRIMKKRQPRPFVNPTDKS